MFDFDFASIFEAANSAPATLLNLIPPPPPPQVVLVDQAAKCAELKFENLFGAYGRLNLHQPAGGEILVDGNFEDLPRDTQYQIAIHALPTSGGSSCNLNELGASLPNGLLGNFVTDFRGSASFQTFKADLDLGDLIGKSIAVRGRDVSFHFTQTTQSN